MRYVLMHKNISVAELEIDEASGNINKVNAVYDEARLPVGVQVKKGVVDRTALNLWWLDRSIPASRYDINKALEALSIQNTRMLLTKCFGLSLSDQYWVKPYDSNIVWSDVNFFDNSFSEDIGDVLIGKAVKRNGFDFHSPDNTSDGCLKKRWKIINGKRCLIKAGSLPFMQQPFNEVIATIIMQRLGISHVPYTLIWDEGVPYCACEDFVTADTELVSAWRVMQIAKKDNKTSVYRHYLNCCEQLGVPDIVHAVDEMIVLDYIIANEDRHQNNFGLLRDVNTLKWIGAAPIFDSGSSLGYDKLSSQIISSRGVECKPFKRTHDEQLKLVTSFVWVDFGKLEGIDREIQSVFEGADEYIDDLRKETIIFSLMKRIDRLKAFAKLEYNPVDDTEKDVIRDVAAVYKVN